MECIKDNILNEYWESDRYSSEKRRSVSCIGDGRPKSLHKRVHQDLNKTDEEREEHHGLSIEEALMYQSINIFYPYVGSIFDLKFSFNILIDENTCIIKPLRTLPFTARLTVGFSINGAMFLRMSVIPTKFHSCKPLSISAVGHLLHPQSQKYSQFCEMDSCLLTQWHSEEIHLNTTLGLTTRTVHRQKINRRNIVSKGFVRKTNYTFKLAMRVTVED